MKSSEPRAQEHLPYLFIAVIFFSLGMHGNSYGEIDVKFCGLRASLFPETDG